MIKVTAAGRAGIIGNPTDGYGGTLISCSIKNKAVTTIEESKDLVIRNHTGETVLRWNNDFDNHGDYFDIVRSVLRKLKVYDLKATISTTTNVPVQAGLAGSTAVIASVLSAVLAFQGKNLNRYEIAEINRDIELNYMKVQCGYQDAYMTTFGGLKYLDFRGKEYYRTWDKEQYGTVEDLSPYIDELPFVIAHTGIKHHSGSFHRPLRERWLEGDREVVKGYADIVEIAREGKKALINSKWEDFAYYMNKNHEIQDSLADSGLQNRKMIQVAKDNGALAAKLAGAGGGGTIIALTFDKERVKTALKEAGAESFVELDPLFGGVKVEKIDRVDKRNQA